MPEIQHILNDTQIWQVSLLLANADKISDAVKDKLKPSPLREAQRRGFDAIRNGRILKARKSAHHSSCFDQCALGHASAEMLIANSRSRGPSSSISTTRCQVPSRSFFFSKGSETEVPIKAERMWSGTWAGLCGMAITNLGTIRFKRVEHIKIGAGIEISRSERCGGVKNQRMAYAGTALSEFLFDQSAISRTSRFLGFN